MQEIHIMIKWGYPLYEATGSRETEACADHQITVREFIDGQVERYPKLEELLEKNKNGKVAALILRDAVTLTDDECIDHDCTLSFMLPLSGG